MRLDLRVDLVITESPKLQKQSVFSYLQSFNISASISKLIYCLPHNEKCSQDESISPKKAGLTGIHGKQLYCCLGGQTESDRLCVFKAFHHFHSIQLWSADATGMFSLHSQQHTLIQGLNWSKSSPKLYWPDIGRHWPPRSFSSIPFLLLQAECNPKQPRSLFSYQFCYPPLTVQPTNMDFIVQSHLYLSWCCSAPLHRQEE